MRLLKTPTFLLIIFVLLNSCVSNLDFDKVDELGLTPAFTSPLISFEVDQSRFVDEVNNIEILSFTEQSRFEIFDNEGIKNHLIQASVSMFIDNEIDRSFNVFIDFLDDNDDVTFSFMPFGIEAKESREVPQFISVDGHPEFLNSTQIRIRIDMISNGNLLDTNIPNKFRFRSIGFYYFNI